MIIIGISLGLLGSCHTESVDSPPNIIFILVDDMGWKDVGFMGNTFYETPHIDQLAAEGMVFTQAYANAPNCAPSRACLMTGMYSPRHGIYTVGTSERGKSRNRKLIPTPNTTTLDTNFVTLAEQLVGAGYTTAHMGKWHLGKGIHGPLNQGFQINIAGNHRGHPKSYFSPYSNEDISDGPDGEYLTDRLIEEATSFIQTHTHTPFFLYLPLYAVHTPIQGKPALIKKYTTKDIDSVYNNGYAAMVETVDQGVGKLMSLLKEQGLEENTLIIFFSDNGGHGAITHMEPLRGSKGMLYEGGIREPLIVKWPTTVAPGSRCDIPVIGIDLYPTLLDICGISPTTSLDGKSWLPLLMGNRDQWNREALYWHFPAYLEAYRGMGLTRPWRTTPVGAIRQGNWKLMEFFEEGELELYDLVNDPSESINLRDSLPEKTAALHADLQAWQQAVKAPIPTERNPEFVEK